MNTIDKQPERHEIEVLLPWYAAGTLSRCDADLVERALARDSELARRYDLVRQELAERFSSTRRSAHRRRAPGRSCSPHSMPRWQVRRAIGVQVLPALLPAITLVIL
jgi:anti-sigma-K factor RskA